MSATWPRPSSLLWPKPIDQPAEIDDGTLRHRRRGRAAGEPRPRRGAGRARRDARPSRRQRPLRLAQARHRRASHRRLGAARQDWRWPQAFGLDVDAVEEVWHGLDAALSAAVRLGRGPRRPADRARRAGVPARSCSPIRSRTRASSLDDYAAEWKWDGIRVQLVRAGGETRLYSRAGDDISGSFPDVAEAFDARRRARRRAAGARRRPGRRRAWRRRGELQRAAAAARPQDRVGRRCWRTIPPSSGSTTSCSTATRICARWPGPSGARGSRPSSPRLDPERFDLSRADRGATASRRWRRSAPARATRRSKGVMLKRRDSPYVAGPPRRPVVQMEARSADRRLRADVCRSAAAASARALFATTPSAAGPTDGELLPVGKAYFGFTDEELKWLDRFVRNHTVAALRPGARGREEPGARSRVRFDPRQQAAQIGPRDALPADQPDPHRQAGRTRPTGSRPCWRWLTDRKSRPAIARPGPAARRRALFADRTADSPRRSCRGGRPRARTRAGRLR